MRVGYGCLILRPGDRGVGHFVASQARALASTGVGHELLLYTNREFPLPTQPAGASVTHVDAGRRTRSRLLRILWEQLALPRRARRDRLDVFHAPAYVMPLHMPVPVVLTVHDVLTITHPEFCTRANRLHHRLLLRASIRHAKRVVVPSDDVRARVIELGDVAAERVEVVLPGVRDELRTDPTPEAITRVRERYRIGGDFALFAGNLEPKKNVARLLRAFAELRAAGAVDGELLLVGGQGWNLPAELIVDSGARYLGYVPDEDLAALYRAARLLAFPSLAEGFGLPVIEAWAAGLPVVCSSVPALAGVDPAAAVIVEPTSVDDIAAGLARAWHDEALRVELIARGRTAAASFCWHRAARRLWQIYAEVLVP